MKINKDKMDIGGITDEHVDRVPVSNKPKLSRKEQKRATKKEWKVRNAAGKRNTDNQKNLSSNDMCEPPNTVLQRSSLDKSIENTVDKGSELSNGFVVKKNTDEMVTGNTRENAKIRNCDKNHNLQSTTLSSNSVKKSAHSDNNNENQGDISKTSELFYKFKPSEPDRTEDTSNQSHNRHEQVIYSTKKPIVDYTFPSNEEYERNPRDSASTAHNLERKDHNKSSILGTTSSIDICSAQAAESSASRIDSTCKKLSMTDKLYKCLFDVAKPVLCERLSRVMDGETIKNLGKYLLKNVHYFYHQKSNASNLTCQCTITGNQFCETLTRIKYHNKNDNLTESVFFNFYTKTNNGRCKECKYVKSLLNRKECLCVYGPKVKKIDYLDFNDLEFLILECDPCISEDDKLAVSKLVFVRNDIVCHRNRPRTDRELNEVWEDTKQNILSLCSSYLKNIFKVNINEIEEMTTVTKKEFEDLQKQIATFNLHFNSEQERLNRSIQDSEQAIKDHISSVFKGANDNSNNNTDEILGEMREGFGKVDALLLFFNIKQDEQAQGNKPKVEVNFKSSSMMNEEKAVNVLSQNDDSDSNGFQIESIERKCLLLVLKASPDIFKNETTLRIAIRSLIVKILKAGDIDTGIPSTINVEVKFNGQFKNDEEDVIRRMLSLSIKEKSKETALQGCQKEDNFAFASTSDDTATTTDYSETLEHLDLRFRKLAVDWSSSSDNVDTDKINASKYQGPIYLTKRPCQSCEEKDKQIQAYETKIKQLQNITEKKELQETSDSIPPGTIEPLSKPFCQCCEDKEKRIKSLKKQHQKELQKCQHNLDMPHLKMDNSQLREVVEGLTAEISKLKDLKMENSQLKEVVEGLTAEISKLKDATATSLVKPFQDDIGMISKTGKLGMKQKVSKSDDFSSLVSEHTYASSLYTKTDKQKGLGIIVQAERSGIVPRYIDPDTTHLLEFFDELGFIVKCTKESDHQQLLNYMTDGQFYCVFIVLLGYPGYQVYNDDLIRHLLPQRVKGKPVIIMTDFTFPNYIEEINDDNEILIVQPIRQRIRDPYRYYREKNIFEDFVKAARRNRFADIMDILKRMNALYDYPLITFHSSLRKKFFFL